MACTSDHSDELLRSRIEDTVRLCEKRYSPCYLGFLDLREQALVQDMMRQIGCVDWRLYGGYGNAERTMLCVYPDYVSADELEYPFVAVCFRYRETRSLTHRDVLGTLLSAGIRRDAIGDILCGVGFSVVFLREEVAGFVCEQVNRIGGEGVVSIPDYDGELPLSKEYIELQETVASPRLDAVVKALVHCSREAAADAVRLGYVSVDHRPVESVSIPVSAPCTISVRGQGRFLIDRIGPETKKGRLRLLARKCI